MAIGKAPGVTLLAPPYFLHQDSPVMDQLRSVKANLKSEFEEFCNHHDMSVCVRVCVWDCLRQGAQHMHGWARMLFSCTHRNVENEPRATVICQWLMSVTPPPPPPQRALVEQANTQGFSWNMATSDVFRCFGKHETVAPVKPSMYGNRQPAKAVCSALLRLLYERLL